VAVTGREDRGTLTLTLAGEIDHHHAGEIMREVDRQIDVCRPRHLVLDMEGVTFLDSSGIAVLLRAYRHITDMGGNMGVRQVPEQAARVFRAASLERVIPFEPKPHG